MMKNTDKKMDLSSISKITMMLFLVIYNEQLTGVEGLRMKQPSVTSSSDVLMVGVPARLTCNYIKYQSERIREITWYAGYNGMSRKVRVYL